MKNELTEMQQFVLNFIKTKGSKMEFNPGYIGTHWFEHKHNRYPPASSRSRFGLTSAAYRTLRKLCELGFIEKVDNYHSYKLKSES